jgi:hypothetical protein
MGGDHRRAYHAAQVLAYAPYVSVALEAHRLCIAAMMDDLRSIGQTWADLNVLASALYETLWGVGLRLNDGTWTIDPKQRGWEAQMPFSADLAWDVDGLLEVAS